MSFVMQHTKIKEVKKLMYEGAIHLKNKIKLKHVSKVTCNYQL